VVIEATTMLRTKFGVFKVSHHVIKDEEFISLSAGDLTNGVPMVRLQSACLFSEAFDSQECNCKQQLADALCTIIICGRGVLVYSQTQEGRGAGLRNKILGMEVERTSGCDSFEAYRRIGLDRVDYRDYTQMVRVLHELNCSNRILFAGNVEKREALKRDGFVIVGQKIGDEHAQ